MKLTDAVEQLRSRQSTAKALMERCLAAARDPAGEGPRVFTELLADAALRAADDADDRLNDPRRADGSVRPLEGVPISVKDLFDVQGTVTRAASLSRPDAVPAAADAPAVARLRAAGAIIVGRTNMTEFAYSGLGLNRNFGTPLNPFDRAAERIPGGSSSGAAVSVSDQMAAAALGTDTGGSVRIPAALCGLVGWKPTAGRISREGVFPLSPSLDSIGPIAEDVAACMVLDAVLTGAPMGDGRRSGLAGVRLAVPAGLLAADTDGAVAAAVERAFALLRRAGALLVELPLPEIVDVPAVGAGPVIAGSEAYTGHRQNLGLRGALYDPRVRERLERGAAYSAWEYLDAQRCRASSIEAAGRALRGFDGWLLPTVPRIAPRIADLGAVETYVEVNKLFLRNTSIVNFLDGCAISLPCHRPGDAPVGLMFAGVRGSDLTVLDLARELERVLDRGLGRSSDG